MKKLIFLSLIIISSIQSSPSPTVDPLKRAECAYRTLFNNMNTLYSLAQRKTPPQDYELGSDDINLVEEMALVLSGVDAKMKTLKELFNSSSSELDTQCSEFIKWCNSIMKEDRIAKRAQSIQDAPPLEESGLKQIFPLTRLFTPQHLDVK